MRQPRNLNKHQEQLLLMFITFPLEMTLEKFQAKWNLSQEKIAEICRCSSTTVSRWFSKKREPKPHHLLYLTLLDMLLESYDSFPNEIKKIFGFK